ncbi:hypothetical protein ACH4GK_19340 [Streptomyces rimosus]|uniref:hypothetical protein n=1 Tax=Streptomyces rimosus TaxID=1927 RepID=UPI0004CA78C4|nr:hypothetical protein [Streptomyces rimosus]
MSCTEGTGTHFFILTVESPGYAMCTQTGTFTPRPGCTREEAFNRIYAQVVRGKPELARPNVVFFSFDRNDLEAS